jgi:NADPH:quinone reductase-like Zn-dependent oxidoreductase
MRALVVRQGAPATLVLAEVPAPVAAPGELIVRVRASTINRGERSRLATAPDGHVFGWDVVGEIAGPGAERMLEGAGTVVGLAGDGGGWAECVAVRASDLAAVPAGVSLAAAATLPVAGLTALRAVSLYPSLLGAKVLIMGGGAVASFAVQLARLGGATVHAAVRAASSAERLTAVGASSVTVGTEPVPGGFDLVVDTVGGSATPLSLAAARPFGRVVVVGNLGDASPGVSSGALLASGALLQGYRLVVDAATRPVRADLGVLLGLVADGRLTPPDLREIDWHDSELVAAALADGFGSARAVLRMAER